jgi:transcriptional regulator with XRE-family HTH domain
MTPKELRQWREQHGLTRESLALLLSPSKKETLSHRTIERWEQNRNAKIPVFLRLALAEVERIITENIGAENN